MTSHIQAKGRLGSVSTRHCCERRAREGGSLTTSPQGHAAAGAGGQPTSLHLDGRPCPATHTMCGISSSRLLSSRGMSLWKKEYRSRSASSQPPTTRVTACRTCGQKASFTLGRQHRGHVWGTVTEDRSGPGSQVLTRLAGQSWARSMLRPDPLLVRANLPPQAQCWLQCSGGDLRAEGV